MKRLIVIITAAAFLGGMVSCKDDGGSSMLPLGASKDAASMLYLQYMYDNDNGARLNEQATAGMPESEGFNDKVRSYMGAPMVESLGQSGEDADSPNWWERMDVDAEGVVSYMKTREGRNAVQNYISSGAMGSMIPARGGSIPERRPYIQIVLAAVQTAMEVYKMCNDISAANAQTNMLSSIDSNLQMLIVWMFFQMKNINDKLDQIQNTLNQEFEQTQYMITYLEGWLKEKDLRDARVLVQSKCDEFSLIDGVDARYREDAIKEFFVTQYETPYNLAYVSAVERTALLNSRPPSSQYRTVPGNMLLSDVMFMRQMSELRLAYAPVYYSGRTLLRYRAQVARKDIQRLLVIKDSLLSDRTPDRDPEYFEDLCALLATWEITLRAHIEVYFGKDVQDVELEDASHYSLGFGTFGDLDGNTSIGTVGRVLANAAGTPLAALFGYGDSLESVFDTGTSGELADGKSLRVVHGGKNLLSDLGLVPIMRRLVSVADMNTAPGKNQFFIDPSTGRMILPRPSFWSRCDSVESITSPEMSTSGHVPAVVLGNLASFQPGKFSSPSIYQQTILWVPEDAFSLTAISPFGSEAVNFMTKGTASFWWKSTASLQAYANVRFYLTDRTWVSAYHNDLGENRLGIHVDSSTPVQSSPNVFARDTWYHIYIVWDNEGGLAGGDTVQVFVNGVKIIGTAVQVAGSPKCVFYLNSGCNIGGGGSWLDNIKIWNHVVSDGSSAAQWEYNGGEGRENALHAIYGPNDDPEYDYRPKLIDDGGIGYYFLR